MCGFRRLVGHPLFRRDCGVHDGGVRDGGEGAKRGRGEDLASRARRSLLWRLGYGTAELILEDLLH